MRRFLAAAFILAAACGGGANADHPPARVAESPAEPPADAAGGWQTNPEAGVAIRDGEPLTLDTGPHTVAWPGDAPELAPPYTVRATLRKRAGRLHEAYGLVFGGQRLGAPEHEQRYSYFLVRGDGSYLVKRRDGAETPLVRDWTRHPAVRRDHEGVGTPQALEVRVAAEEAVFLVNGQEVARVPAAELDLAGRAGIRVSHDVRLEVDGFEAFSGIPGGTAAP